MASVNKVILIGNIGRDPEVRYMPSGSAVCNLAVATSYKRKDKTSGDTTEETEWHRVSLFDRLAEIAGEYLKKGRPVYIEGRLKTRKWQDKDGKDQYTTEIVAEQMQMLGGRDGAEAPTPAPQAQQRHGDRPGARPAAKAAPTGTGFDDIDDDIPFILNMNDGSLRPGKERRLSRGSFTGGFDA